MVDRYVRMNILSSGGDKAKLTLDQLAAQARKLEAESPDLKITADDTKASATIKDLQLKIEILNRQRAEVAFETKGDEQAKAKLLRIDAMLRDLSAKVAKPDIKIQGTERAEADLIKIKLLMDDIHNKKVSVGISKNDGVLANLFARLVGGGGGGGAGGAAVAAEGGGGIGSSLLSTLGGANNQYMGLLIAGLVAAIGSIAPAIGPLAIGGLVGGGGLAGGLALGSSAQKQLAALEKQLSTTKNGKQKKQLEGDISDFEKEHAPELNLSETGNNLLQSLEGVFSGALSSQGKGGVKPVNIGNKSGFEQVVTPSFMQGITGVLSQIGSFAKSIGPDLGDMFRASLPFISAFAKVVEQLAVALMPAFTQSMKAFTPYLPQMVQGFKILSEGVADFIVDLGPGMKDGVTVFKALMEGVKGILIGLAFVFDGLAIAFANIGHYSEIYAKRIYENWANFQHQIAGGFDQTRHYIAAVWDATWNDSIGAFIRFTGDFRNWEADFNHDIARTFSSIRHDTAATWDAMWSGVSIVARETVSGDLSTLKGWWDNITHGFDSLRHSVASTWDGLWADAKRMAESGVRGLSSAVHGIISAFETPVRFVVDNVWDRLAGIWNSIQGVVHVGFKLPVVHMATGGRIPGYGGGDSVPALLERGEVVVDKDRAAALAPVFRAAGVPGFSGGGIIGGIGNFFSGIGKDILGWVTKPLSFIASHVFGAVEGMLPQIGGGALGTVLKTMMTDVIKSLSGSLHMSDATSGVSGNVRSYTPDVLQALRLLGLPASDLGIVLSQMTTESGGNPRAVNDSDSNAKAGTPSTGLMQVIGPTFARWAGPFRNVGPFLNGVSIDPLANIYAGLDYAVHRYGAGWTSVLGHGHGYANGGLITEPIIGTGLKSGMHYSFGENGMEYVNRAGTFGGPGGGDVYNIMVKGDTDPDGAALKIIQKIRRYKKHHGNQPTGIG